MLYGGDMLAKISMSGRFGIGVIQFMHVAIMAAIRFTGVFMPAKHNVVSFFKKQKKTVFADLLGRLLYRFGCRNDC